MEKTELFKDSGLFLGQNIFEFSLPESFEDILTILHTIKEYRDYSNPDEGAWVEYIHQIFHILGFSTEATVDKYIMLRGMGENLKNNALVSIISPKEDINATENLEWKTYLINTAKLHHVRWGVLTNGLQLLIIDCGVITRSDKYFFCELDKIIRSENTDAFFTLYKIFNLIDNKSKKVRSVSNMNPIYNEMVSERVDQRRPLYKDFWVQLLLRSKTKTKLFENRSPALGKDFNISAGVNGIYYQYIIITHDARAEIYIAKGDINWNKRVFDLLYEKKAEIEGSFGGTLSWERVDDKQASYIKHRINGLGLYDRDMWPELQDQMIDGMMSLEKAFQPFIQNFSKKGQILS